MEVWAYYSSRFEVSTHGRVYDKREKEIAPVYQNGRGYAFVGCLATGHKVHQMVLQTFRPKPSSLYTMIDHFDGNKMNARLDNLRWSNSALNALNKKGVRGYHTSKSGKFVAAVKCHGCSCYLGTFTTEKAARTAYLEGLERCYEICDEFQLGPYLGQILGNCRRPYPHPTHEI